MVLSKLDQVLAGVESPDSSALREFLKAYDDFDARPKVLVRCVRTAFRDQNTYGEVAVTEDRDIVCQAVSSYDLVGNPHAWRPLALPQGSSTIVELKYVNCPPAWMANLMSDLASYRVRFSKYATAMEQHVAKPEYSAPGGVNTMRTAVVSVAILFSLQSGLYGQSSLTFAWVFEKGEMPNVGFTTINPGKEPAETTFTLYGKPGRSSEQRRRRSQPVAS